MAYEQGGDSFSALIKGTTKIVAGTAVVKDTDGNYIVNNVTQGPVDGILLEDVSPTAGTAAGGKTGSIAVPNGSIRKAVAGGTIAITDLIAFDTSGNAIAFTASSSGKRSMGKPMVAAVSGDILPIQFMVIVPTTFVA